MSSAEVGHRQDDALTGGVRPGDEVGQVLALESVPSRPVLLEGAVGVHPDREVVQRREAGDAEPDDCGKVQYGANAKSSRAASGAWFTRAAGAAVGRGWPGQLQ